MAFLKKISFINSITSLIFSLSILVNYSYSSLINKISLAQYESSEQGYESQSNPQSNSNIPNSYNGCPGISKYLDIIHNESTHLLNITAIEHINNSNLLVIGSSRGQIELWDFQLRTIITRFAEPVEQLTPINKIHYVPNLEQILVIYELSPSSKHFLIVIIQLGGVIHQDKTTRLMALWDPQSQTQIFSYPLPSQFAQNDYIFCGNIVIDVLLQPTTSNELKVVILTDISLLQCFNNRGSKSLSCSVLGKINFKVLQILPSISGQEEKFSLFTPTGIIEFNMYTKIFEPLLFVPNANYTKCLNYPTAMKYALINQNGDSIYIFSLDPHKDNGSQLIELNSFKQQEYYSKDDSSKMIQSIFRVGLELPFILIQFYGGTVLNINYEDDLILEQFHLSQRANFISSLKTSPSFFSANIDGSIYFYKQSSLISKVILPSPTKISPQDYLFDGSITKQNVSAIYQSNLVVQRQISIASNHNYQSSKNGSFNMIADLQPNELRTFALSNHSPASSNSYSLSIPTASIADFFVNFQQKILYVYNGKDKTLNVCDQFNFSNCFVLSAPLEFCPDVMEMKTQRFIHFYPEQNLLVLNDFNSYYVYYINQEFNGDLESHLRLVNYYKTTPLEHDSEQYPVIINKLKRKLISSTNEILILTSDGLTLNIVSYNIDSNLFNLVSNQILANETKLRIVGMEIVPKYNMVLLQFNNNQFTLLELNAIHFERMTPFSVIKNTNQKYFDDDMRQYVDLLFVNGTSQVISQFSNKRIVVFNLKTHDIIFTSDPLNSFVRSFNIDFGTSLLYTNMYSSTENIIIFELVLQYPFSRLREERGSIRRAQIYQYEDESLIYQHSDFSFRILNLKNIESETHYLFSIEAVGYRNVSFFAYKSIFYIFTAEGFIDQYPLFSETVLGPPRRSELDCDGCDLVKNVQFIETEIDLEIIIYNKDELMFYQLGQTNMLWYRKFQTPIIGVKLNINEGCLLYVGFTNSTVSRMNCNDHTNVYEDMIIQVNKTKIINFEISFEDPKSIFIVSEQGVEKLSLIEINLSEESSLPLEISTPIFQLLHSKIVLSKYIKQIRLQAFLTTEGTLILIGFGQKQELNLSSLISNLSDVVLVDCTIDRQQLIISTPQRIWFLSTGSLFLHFDYYATEVDFSSQPIIENEGFYNICKLSIFFTASDSLNTLGSGAKTNPFSDFRAIQSQIILLGLNNLIFNYTMTEIFLHFYSHPTYSIEVQKELNIKSSKSTHLHFIGTSTQNSTVSKLLMIENYKFKEFKSLSFRSLCIGVKRKNIEKQINYVGIFFSASIDNVYLTNISLFNTPDTMNIIKRIYIGQTSTLYLVSSEIVELTFYLSQVIEVKINNSILSSSSSGSLNDLNLIYPLFQQLYTKSAQSILQSLVVTSSTINQLNLYTFECTVLKLGQIKTPEVIILETKIIQSSIFGMNTNCLSPSIFSISKVVLYDNHYEESSILTDGKIDVSEIEYIDMGNKTPVGAQKQPSLVLSNLFIQNGSTALVIKEAIFENLYINDSVFFVVRSDIEFNLIELRQCLFKSTTVFLIAATIPYSKEQTKQDAVGIQKVTLSKLNFRKNSFSHGSKVISLFKNSKKSLQITITEISFLQDTLDYSQIISAGEKSMDQSLIKIGLLLINQSFLSYSYVIVKSNNIFIEIERISIREKSIFNFSTLLWSSSRSDLNAQNSDSLEMPVLNTVEVLEIISSTFTQSIVFHFYDKESLYVEDVFIESSNFVADIINDQNHFSNLVTSHYNQIMSGRIQNENIQEPLKIVRDLQRVDAYDETILVRYLFEATNIQIYRATVIFNTFEGIIFAGKPKGMHFSDNVIQKYQNLTFSNNRISPESNYVIFEINFGTLNQKSKVEIINFNVFNNTVDISDSNIPIGKLEYGLTFYLFGSDKLGRIRFLNGTLSDNKNVGFADIKYSVSTITIQNVQAWNNDQNHVIKQPFILIEHPRSLYFLECNFSKIITSGAPFLSIEVNRQYFGSAIQKAINSSLIYQSSIGEEYIVLIQQSIFQDLKGIEITQSIASSVICFESGLEVRIRITNCIFKSNTIAVKESYSRSSDLSQLGIFSTYGRIIFSNNQFSEGRILAPSNFFQNIVYFHITGQSITFMSNKVQLSNFFSGECANSDTVSFSDSMGGGVLEGTSIGVHTSSFNGMCTNSQPLLSLILYDSGAIQITDSQFSEIFALIKGGGISVNGLNNKIVVAMNNLKIDSILSPSLTSEGFFVFQKLADSSEIFCKNIKVTNLNSFNGALFSSKSYRTKIILENIAIDNRFDRNLFLKFQKSSNEIGKLKSSEVYSVLSSNSDLKIAPLLKVRGSHFFDLKLTKNQKNNLRQSPIEEKIDLENLLANENVYSNDVINQISAHHSLAIQIRLKNAGSLISIENAESILIQRLKITNYGYLGSGESLISIKNSTNCSIAGLDISNVTSSEGGSLFIVQKSFSLNISNASISNNYYDCMNLIIVEDMIKTQNYFTNIVIFENFCARVENCISPILLLSSVIQINEMKILANTGRNWVGGLMATIGLRDTELQEGNFPKQIQISYEMEFSKMSIERNEGWLAGGMAISIYSGVFLLIKDSIFLNNIGFNAGGLHLKLDYSNTIQFEQVEITGNKGNLAGGLMLPLSSTLQIRDSYSKFVSGNFPNQITSGPRQFRFTQESEKLFTKISNQKYLLTGFNSGDKLPTFSIDVFDQNGELCYISSDMKPKAQIELSQESKEVKGNFLKIYDVGPAAILSDFEDSSQFDEKFSIFHGYYFDNIQIYGLPGTTVSIQVFLDDIKFENIKQIDMPSALTFWRYNFTIDVQMRKCVVGEFIKNSTITSECEECPPQSYSLVDPKEQPSAQCLKCPENTTCLGKNSLSVDPGYWRESSRSDTVIECGLSSTNCLGGILEGDASCQPGRVGPLCETCDIKKGLSDLSFTECLSCSDETKKIIIVGVGLIYFGLFIGISLNSTISRVKRVHLLFEYSSQNNIGSLSMLAKQFVNYIQILSLISQFRFTIISGSIRSAVTKIGNPIIQIFNVFNCFSLPFSESQEIPHVYISLIGCMLVPIIFCLIVYIWQKIAKWKDYYSQSYSMKNSLQIVFLLFSPLILERSMQLLTCRSIGGKYYVSGSLIYGCDQMAFLSIQHLTLIVILIILNLIIPIILFKKIHNRLKTKQPMKYYEYFVGDFKKKFYYWEFVRFSMKTVLFILPSLLQDDLRTMGQLLNVVLIFYIASVQYFKPYWTKSCQRMEVISGGVIVISFHAGLLCYDKPTYSAWWWVLTILLAAINVPLFCWFLKTFVVAYIPKIQNNSIFKKKLRNQSNDGDEISKQARVRLLWSFVLQSVLDSIKNEKLRNYKEKIKKIEERRRSTILPFVNDELAESQISEDENNPNKSKLLWWHESNNSVSLQSTDIQEDSEKGITEPLLIKEPQQVYDQGRQKKMNNPYHDFNFDFLPNSLK